MKFTSTFVQLAVLLVASINALSDAGRRSPSIPDVKSYRVAGNLPPREHMSRRTNAGQDWKKRSHSSLNRLRMEKKHRKRVPLNGSMADIGLTVRMVGKTDSTKELHHDNPLNHKRSLSAEQKAKLAPEDGHLHKRRLSVQDDSRHKHRTIFETQKRRKQNHKRSYGSSDESRNKEPGTGGNSSNGSSSSSTGSSDSSGAQQPQQQQQPGVGNSGSSQESSNGESANTSPQQQQPQASAAANPQASDAPNPQPSAGNGKQKATQTSNAVETTATGRKANVETSDVSTPSSVRGGTPVQSSAQDEPSVAPANSSAIPDNDVSSVSVPVASPQTSGKKDGNGTGSGSQGSGRNQGSSAGSSSNGGSSSSSGSGLSSGGSSGSSYGSDSGVSSGSSSSSDSSSSSYGSSSSAGDDGDDDEDCDEDEGDDDDGDDDEDCDDDDDTTDSTTTSDDTTSSSSGGMSFTGQATYYSQNGNAGSCGNVAQDSDMVVAIKTNIYSDGAKCGDKVTLTNTANGNTATAVVADTCPTCEGDAGIDLSEGLFSSLSDNNMGLGVLQVKYTISS